MPAWDYLIGLALLGATLGPVVAASEVVRRRRLGHLEGAPRVVAHALAITGGVVAVHAVPLALGVLARGTAVAAALLLLAASLLVPRTAARKDGAAPREAAPGAAAERRPTVSWLAAVAALAGVGGLAVASFLQSAGTPTQAPDLVSYDLPIVARWIQTGSAWQITELFPLQTHGTYPHNAHVVVLSAMLPFHNDALVRFVVYPFLAVFAVAVYGLAVELGAPRASATLVAAAAAAIPVVATTVEFAPLDAIGVALFAGGLLFLVRHARTRRGSELVLAGVGLGLALGSKWYTATAVGALVVVWAASGVLARRPVLRDGAALAATIAAAGGLWLVRNLVQTGDPVHPQAVSVLGATLFDAPRDLYRELAGFSLAHYLDDWAVWREYVLPDFGSAFGLGGAVLVVAGALAAIVAVAARRTGPRRGVGMLAAGLPVLVAVYLVTPYSAFGYEGAPALTSANTRYAIPALVVAAGLAGWLAGRVPRLRAPLELAALAATVQGVGAAARDLALPRREVALAAALLALAVAVTWALRRRGAGAAAEAREPWAGWLDVRPRPRALAAAAVGLAIVGGGGWIAQRALNDDRYGGVDPTYDWVAANAREGVRVGLAGYWDFNGLSPAWPLFGERLDNEVGFVGELDGGQLRQLATAPAWARAVRDGRYDVVLVARTRSPFPPGADETAWARRAGLRPVAESPRFVLFEIPAARG